MSESRESRGDIWSKSGPVDLRTIPEMLQQIQENMESSWQNIIYVNMGLNFFEHVRQNVCPRYHVFRFLFSFVCLWRFVYIF